MWTMVSCRKFHNTDKLGRLFQVGAQAEGSSARDDPGVDVSQVIEVLLTQGTTQLEEVERKKNAAIEADTDQYDFSEWLDREGWARHLKGLKRDWLLAIAMKPTRKEGALLTCVGDMACTASIQGERSRHARDDVHQPVRIWRQHQ
ncbi:hypothetical protein GQ44DRAFT_714352 [Phaeosphaeriaceae sp. PMI808]|nr:hypothetical protein GQ44DRAFT_714352 [Phaeosphaeriaceae sp. PMI808]